jgi:hypothetical protein
MKGQISVRLIRSGHPQPEGSTLYYEGLYHYSSIDPSAPLPPLPSSC